ncbi:MAG: hypothetical protein U5K33_00010 [Halofilum sp. (in: g-proteobacteria)]|nr:hypothetical protein [Halofilum sp. (in: g-proteobacteria)]
MLETNHDTEQPSEFDTSDADRRLRLDKAPQPALASLRWQNRPAFPEGNPSRTYMVNHPGGKFAVFVGYTENGEKHPFEVWVNGAEQPRGAGAIAKALSMDMRTRDAAWLKAKLDSLGRVHDQAFDLPMPPDGEPQRVPSAVAAMALLIKQCCKDLGVFDREGETPVLDALMSPKEPKTGASGTMSWTVDVLNPNTGDDFVLGLKELSLPDGERRPYSMWLAGEYPRALDGLCKVLSYDMRVIDPAWIGAKLRTLVDFPEAQGDFLAWVPGHHRQAVQPSTVAYIARLMIHRYNMLGILDEEGFPVQPMDVMFTDTNGVEEYGDNIIPMRLRAAGANEVTPGSRCSECGNYADDQEGWLRLLHRLWGSGGLWLNSITARATRKMAESDTERLVRLYKEGICPYCARNIPKDEGVGSGKTSDGRFCSLECYTRYHEHELIERHQITHGCNGKRPSRQER